MPEKVISRPAQLTPEWHREILFSLRRAVEEGRPRFAEARPGAEQIRVREWRFSQEGGALVVQIFLDKGPKSGEIDLDDCLLVHHWLFECGALDVFSDDLGFEISSAGTEPYLRDPEDFEPFLGKRVCVDTWAKQEGRGRYVMDLEAVEREDGGRLVLKEGPHRFAVPFSNIKSAQGIFVSQKQGKKPPKKR